MQNTSIRLRQGGWQTGVALGLAGATAGIIAAASWTEIELAGRLAIAGVALFGIALVLGSSRLVGLATVPVLAGALVASAAAADPAWIRSIAVGCLWYIAAELAWEAIERRDGIESSAGLDARRVNEVATVIMLSLATTTTGFLFSFLAPARTMVVVGSVVVAFLAAARWAARHIAESESADQVDGSDPHALAAND